MYTELSDVLIILRLALPFEIFICTYEKFEIF